MKLAYRFLLTLFTFLFMVWALLVTALMAGWDVPYAHLDFILANNNIRWIIGIIAFVFFFAGLITLIGSLQKPRVSKTIVQSTSLGDIQISLSALESIVKRAALQVKGVREVKTKIKHNEQGAAFFLQVTLFPGVNIPEITENLQQNVNSEVQKSAGIQVLEVKILVESLAAESKARVE